jgi:hypothetical protein
LGIRFSELGIRAISGIGLGMKQANFPVIIDDLTAPTCSYLLESEADDLLAMQKVEGSSPFSRL